MGRGAVIAFVSALVLAGLLAAPGSAPAVEIWGIDNLTDPDNLIKFDSSTPGTVTVVGSTGVPGGFFYGLDFDAAGNLYGYEAFAKLYRLDQTTGAATLIGGGGVDVDDTITDLSWNPVAGQMLAVSLNANLYTIDLSTGAATLVGGITGLTSPVLVGLASDAAGVNYILDLRTDQMYQLTGLAATALGGVGFNANFSQGMAIDWSAGGVWYLGGTDQSGPQTILYTVNATSGLATPVGFIGPGPQSFEPGDIAINPTLAEGVPEPTSVLLLGGGLAGLAGLGWRRSRRK